MPLPDGQLAIVVCIPSGRDQNPLMHQITRERATNRPVTDPRTGKPIYVYPYPVRVIGSEFAAGRNQLVKLVFEAEATISADYQQAENDAAAAQGRAAMTVPPMTFDYTLWIDDDVMVPETIVEQLLRHDVQICSGLYFMRKAPYLPVAYTTVGDPLHEFRFWNLTAYPEDSLIEVDAVGMGCVLIDMDVFRKIPAPWFAWGTPEVHAPDAKARRDIERKWDAMWHEQDHRALGEDLYFCTRAKQSGFRVHLDTGAKCQHIGEQFYDEAFFREHQIHYYRVPPPGRMSVLFAVVPSPKAWDGRSLYDEPLGGSESSVAYLARSLARLHHTVFVVCDTRDGQVVDVDGVCYRPYASLNGALQHPWDAVIVVRWPDAISYPMGDDVKSLIFWAHDLMRPDDLLKAYGANIPDQDGTDAFVALTPFHHHFTQVHPWDRTEHTVIPNGLDLSLFQGAEPRDPNRLIWTSNPNRGLANAVRIFRRLRQTWPELTLHIYGRSAVYGWGTEDPLHERFYLPDAGEPNVVVHDPLPKAQLARELMKSSYLFYPTSWPETFSIAATEAQAAGTPVLATPYGALVDTVKGGLLSYNTEADFERLHTDHDFWELLSLRGREWAGSLSWDTVALTWVKLIEGIQARRRQEGRLK